MVVISAISIILILAGAGYALYRHEDYYEQAKWLGGKGASDSLNTRRKKWRNVWAFMLMLATFITAFIYAVFGYKVLFVFVAGLIFHYLVFESMLHKKLFKDIFHTGKTHTKNEFPKTRKQAIIFKSVLLLLAVAAIIIFCL